MDYSKCIIFFYLVRKIPKFNDNMIATSALNVLLGNLALNKYVWEDSPWKSDRNWRGRNAVDGKRDDRSANGGQCVISENGRNEATLRVDLGRMVSISHIDVYYRTENLQSMKYITNFFFGNFFIMDLGHDIQLVAKTNYYEFHYSGSLHIVPYRICIKQTKALLYLKLFAKRQSIIKLHLYITQNFMA